MFGNSRHGQNNTEVSWPSDSALGRSMSRRTLIGAGALLGLSAIALPTERAFAWSSWTNATSDMLKSTGMGDCMHEDMVQISYARLLRNHAYDSGTDSLLNPWAGTIGTDARYATVAGDTVDRGSGATFTDADDLAARLFRENLAYLRIGSYWNDAAANILVDFGLSCFAAENVPVFSGSNYYEGAWDVGQHIHETNEANKTGWRKGLDALVQFTMNDRNNFIHGMLSSTANHSRHLKQSDIKKFALQWLGVAYEYARTGTVTATNDVTLEQAEKIFKGFIDTYGQLDENAHDMSMSLEVGSFEASIKLPRRRLRLRALGMMCHTLEDLWCPAHTCRTYHADSIIPQNSIVAFSNYKLQNGNAQPMKGYHIPFDRYAASDSNNATNWREALTRGNDTYPGSETLANALDASMDCLADAHTYFNTMGMNESIATITQLFEYLYQGTAWDDGVRAWVDTEIMPTYFDRNGESLICPAGRRSLHSPTYLLGPITSTKRAYRKVGLTNNYDAILAAAKSYDAWQRGAHLFYSGKYNTSMSKYITPGNEGDSVWTDSEGEHRLVDLANRIYAGSCGLSSSKQSELLARIGCNGCHDMASVVSMVSGMLQEFSIDLTGRLRAQSDATMKQLEDMRAFFESGAKGTKSTQQSEPDRSIFAVPLAYADEDDSDYMTSSMALEDFVRFKDGSYLIAVRDMDSLETSVMSVPANTPGKEKLETEGLANLTISYTLQTEFDDDLEYRYIVNNIDYSDLEENVYLVTGTVKSLAANKKSLVLDLNGISEFDLDIRDGIPSIPEVGAYICARYSLGKSYLELVDYDELEAPGTLKKVRYPVVKAVGTTIILLTNENGAADGYRDYMEIDYEFADVRSIPQEGHYATVYYHDEAYGVTQASDDAVRVAAPASGVTTQSASDEMTNSAKPGYLEMGDDYWKLDYGSEIFHVANVVAGEDEVPDNHEGVTTPKPTAAPGTQNANGSNGQRVTGSTAKTDDPLAGLGALFPAAAVAGAAFAAYSARRVENEKKRMQNP